MEKLDKDLQKRVWQRVQGDGAKQMPPLRQENLKPWIMAAQENALCYSHLARELGGKHGQQLKKLAQQAKSCAACARGICRIRGEQVKVPQLQPAREPAKRMLEKCCHRERRLWEEAERRSVDPEYGPAYSRLARQAGERYAAVLELLGEME